MYLIHTCSASFIDIGVTSEDTYYNINVSLNELKGINNHFYIHLRPGIMTSSCKLPSQLDQILGAYRHRRYSNTPIFQFQENISLPSPGAKQC
jgi:hypothetical protein